MAGGARRAGGFGRAGPSLGLPKGIFAALRRQANPPIRVSPILVESASLAPDAVYARLRSRARASRRRRPRRGWPSTARTS